MSLEHVLSRMCLHLKVPITLKYFFRLKKSLHLFETHCAFLPLLTQILIFYRL